MLPINIANMERDMDNAIIHVPVSMTFNKQTFNATLGEVERENDVLADGVFKDRRLELIAKKTSFTGGTLPAVQDSITLVSALNPAIDGIYYIMERDDSQDGVSVTFILLRHDDTAEAP